MKGLKPSKKCVLFFLILPDLKVRAIEEEVVEVLIFKELKEKCYFF